MNTLVSRAGMSLVGINQAICAGVMGAWSAPLVRAEAAECDRGSSQELQVDRDIF
ncbi:hypothetical protein [Microcoleus sp. AT3-D2]|uniref:hypothetical protein n=1 Tax=Microcoleus sp. AT3-D2 TaxID=2818612 RepID=UPI002FD2EB9E